jgi:DivIVA domain-containing protein
MNIFLQLPSAVRHGRLPVRRPASACTAQHGMDIEDAGWSEPLTTAWFDEQHRLSPDELQSATFPMSGLGRRGYEEAAVNRFLRKVHAEFVQLINERASLWQDVQRLRQRILAGETNSGPQAVLFGEADPHAHAVQILSTAQVSADRYLADSGGCSQVTEEARRRRDDIMREAQQHSDMILEKAHTKAREAAASALNEAPPQTDTEQRALQAELAYLRTYSSVYRAHLLAYTESVLAGIEEWERKEAGRLQQREPDSLHEPAFGHADQRSLGS